jgi:hypothetical protein
MISTVKLTVTSASQYETKSGSEMSCHCQITEMEMTPAAKDSTEAANKLYAT